MVFITKSLMCKAPQAKQYVSTKSIGFVKDCLQFAAQIITTLKQNTTVLQKHQFCKRQSAFFQRKAPQPSSKTILFQKKIGFVCRKQNPLPSIFFFLDFVCCKQKPPPFHFGSFFILKGGVFILIHPVRIIYNKTLN